MFHSSVHPQQCSTQQQLTSSSSSPPTAAHHQQQLTTNSSSPPTAAHHQQQLTTNSSSPPTPAHHQQQLTTNSSSPPALPAVKHSLPLSSIPQSLLALLTLPQTNHLPPTLLEPYLSLTPEPYLSLTPQDDNLPCSSPTRCLRYIIYISVLKEQLKLVHELMSLRCSHRVPYNLYQTKGFI